MSGPAQDATPDPRIVAVFAVVAWVAAVIAVFGLLSLALGLDVVRQEDAGPLLGPVMVLLAAVALGLLLVRVQRTKQPAGVSFVGSAAGVYLVMLFVGAIGYTAISGQPAQLLFFVFDYAVSPFVVSAAVLAGLVSVGVLALSSRDGERGRPRWPWEDRDAP